VQLDAAHFERKLAEAYSSADQTVAEVADDIGQELDLSRLVQELPPIEELPPVTVPNESQDGSQPQ